MTKVQTKLEDRARRFSEPDAAKPEPRSAEAAAEIAKALSGNALGHSEEGFWGTFGSLGALLGHSWGLLGAIGGTPGVLLGTLWHSLGLFGLFLGPFCALLWHLWATFGWLCASSGFLLGCFGELLASFWTPLDVFVDTFGVMRLN